MLFCAIDRKVVQLPLATAHAHELVRVPPHRGMTDVLPEERALGDRGFGVPAQFRDEAVTSEGGGSRGSGRLGDRREDIDDVLRRVDDLACGDAAGRPRDDQGGRDTAFVHPLLVEPEGRVREVRPGAPVAREGVLGARFDVARIADAHGTRVARFGRGDVRREEPSDGELLGLGAVVGEEQDQRVVAHPEGVELVEDLAHATVQCHDLGGVHLHAALLPLGVLDVGPRGFVRVAWCRVEGGGEDPEGLLPGEPRLTRVVPSRRVAPALSVDVVGGGLQRPVGCRVGEMEEERPVLGMCVGDESDRATGQCRREVELLIRVDRERLLAREERVGVEVARPSAEDAEELLESSTGRPAR
jgi:hypothetical protein